MSTPENEPQNPPVNPTPPQYGQVAPEGQKPQAGAPAANPYGQNPAPYGQAPSQNPYGQAPNTPYGQPPQAPSPYGQQPYAGGFPVPPQGNFAPPQMPTERPKELNIAFWAIIAAGVLTVIGSLMFDSALIRSQMASMPEVDQLLTEAGMSVDDFVGLVKTMVTVMSVVSLGIYVLIAFMVRKGSNVARIFATIFAALSLLSLAGAPILSILAVVLGIVGVVFAWLRPSSNYIAARRAARAAGYR